MQLQRFQNEVDVESKTLHADVNYRVVARPYFDTADVLFYAYYVHKKGMQARENVFRKNWKNVQYDRTVYYWL